MLFYSLYALLGFVCGIHILYNLNTQNLIFTALLFLFAVLFFSIIKRLRTFVLSVLIFGIFAAIGLFCIDSASNASYFTDEYVTVTGRISELPYKSSDLWCYTVDCREIDYGGIKEKFNSRITVYSENEYRLDDTVDVGGFLELHDTEKNPGTFNSYTYYKAKNIDYKITSIEDKISQKIYKSYTPYAYANRVRNHACNIIEEKFDSDTAAILKIILANFRKDLDQDYTNKLLTSGVLRCLYSPYFHLILLIAVCEIFMCKTGVGKRRFVLCLLCVSYLLINPYVLSARKLFLFVIFRELLRTKAGIFRSIDILWAVILLCGIQNPYILYNEGFIMSGLATLFIILFYEKLFKKISWINTHKKVLNVLVLFFIISIIMLPVAAFLFGGTSMYSIFISVLLMPIVNTVCIISPIIILFDNIVISEILYAFVTFIKNVPYITEHLPFSYVFLPKPSFALLLAYLFLLGAIYKKKTKNICSLLLSVSLGLCFACVTNEFLRAQKPTVTFLTAGQGDCTITDIPYKCTIMVDGGGSAEYNKNYDAGERDILPYLKNSNISTLDYVFVSHYHKDHADGIASLIDNIKIKNIFLPDCLIENEYRVIIEKKAKKCKIKLHYIKGPAVFELEDGVLCEILHFDAFAKDENDTSVVMRITCGDLSCLYTGDITRDTEEKLLDSDTDLSADILKVAHHGSSTSSTKEFLTAVNPELAVAMMPEANSYNFPSPETVENFESLNIPLLTTAEEKCIQIKESKGELIWQRKTR